MLSAGGTCPAPTEAERRVEQSSVQVKGGQPCPGKVDARVNLYWVLPDAELCRECGFAVLSPLQEISKVGGIRKRCHYRNQGQGQPERKEIAGREGKGRIATGESKGTDFP